MDFLRFWKKLENQPETKPGTAPASEIPLFSSLGPAELKLVEGKMRRVEYKAGELVYLAGEEPEAFYIIHSGRFRIVNPRGETITILSQGDYFGESSILLGRRHSASVEAKNGGILFKIDKKDFQILRGFIGS